MSVFSPPGEIKSTAIFAVVITASIKTIFNIKVVTLGRNELTSQPLLA